MAPKRKRADDSPSASTRVTRSSTRISNGTASAVAGTSKPTVSKRQSTMKSRITKVLTHDSEEGAPEHLPVASKSAPLAKKPRTKGISKASQPPARAKTKINDAISFVRPDDESGAVINLKNSSHVDEPVHGKALSPQASNSAGVPPPTSNSPTSKSIAPVKAQQSLPLFSSDPYTPQRALALFETYADNDNPNLIGPEGFERLCADARISLEGALPLILAWQLSTKDMGKITKDEWNAGTESLKIASLAQLVMVVNDLQNILFLNKSASRGSAKKDPYDKTAYWMYCGNRKAAFRKLYMFCFHLAKPEESRNVDIETSAALWSVLLVSKYPIVSEVLSFINEKGTYRATNKDLWTMMLEFCETVNPDLSDYEGEGAWPTMLDQFVLWKKGKTDNVNGNGIKH